MASLEKKIGAKIEKGMEKCADKEDIVEVKKDMAGEIGRVKELIKGLK